MLTYSSSFGLCLLYFISKILLVDFDSSSDSDESEKSDKSFYKISLNSINRLSFLFDESLTDPTDYFRYEI